jgi:hypothetical protein
MNFIKSKQFHYYFFKYTPHSLLSHVCVHTLCQCHLIDIGIAAHRFLSSFFYFLSFIGHHTW